MIPINFISSILKLIVARLLCTEEQSKSLIAFHNFFPPHLFLSTAGDGDPFCRTSGVIIVANFPSPQVDGGKKEGREGGRMHALRKEGSFSPSSPLYLLLLSLPLLNQAKTV